MLMNDNNTNDSREQSQEARQLTEVGTRKDLGEEISQSGSFWGFYETDKRIGQAEE